MAETTNWTAFRRRRLQGDELINNFLSWSNKLFGPGLITGAADDDPSGIATYSSVGAQFGTSMLWTMPLIYPFMAAIQEISARLGRVTGRGIAFKEDYLAALIAVLGTTISPYLLFWQSGEEVEQTAAPVMCFMMLLASQRKVMGKLTLPFDLKILGWIATAIMVLAAIGMLLTSGRPH